MKKTISYSSIEKIVYEFDEDEIRKAILKDNGIAEYKPGRELEFEIYESAETENIVAIVTLIFEKEKSDD